MGCLKTDVYNYEKEKILMALSVCTTVADAAKFLGLNRTTLCEKLKRFKIKAKQTPRGNLLVQDLELPLVYAQTPEYSKE